MTRVVSLAGAFVLAGLCILAECNDYNKLCMSTNGISPSLWDGTCEEVGDLGEGSSLHASKSMLAALKGMFKNTKKPKKGPGGAGQGGTITPNQLGSPAAAGLSCKAMLSESTGKARLDKCDVDFTKFKKDCECSGKHMNPLLGKWTKMFKTASKEIRSAGERLCGAPPKFPKEWKRWEQRKGTWLKAPRAIRTNNRKLATGRNWHCFTRHCWKNWHYRWACSLKTCKKDGRKDGIDFTWRSVGTIAAESGKGAGAASKCIKAARNACKVSASTPPDLAKKEKSLRQQLRKTKMKIRRLPSKPGSRRYSINWRRNRRCQNCKRRHSRSCRRDRHCRQCTWACRQFYQALHRYNETSGAWKLKTRVRQLNAQLKRTKAAIRAALHVHRKNVIKTCETDICEAERLGSLHSNHQVKLAKKVKALSDQITTLLKTQKRYLYLKRHRHRIPRRLIRKVDLDLKRKRKQLAPLKPELKVITRRLRLHKGKCKGVTSTNWHAQCRKNFGTWKFMAAMDVPASVTNKGPQRPCAKQRPATKRRCTVQLAKLYNTCFFATKTTSPSGICRPVGYSAGICGLSKYIQGDFPVGEPNALYAAQLSASRKPKVQSSAGWAGLSAERCSRNAISTQRLKSTEVTRAYCQMASSLMAAAKRHCGSAIGSCVIAHAADFFTTLCVRYKRTFSPDQATRTLCHTPKSMPGCATCNPKDISNNPVVHKMCSTAKAGGLSCDLSDGCPSSLAAYLHACDQATCAVKGFTPAKCTSARARAVQACGVKAVGRTHLLYNTARGEKLPHCIKMKVDFVPDGKSKGVVARLPLGYTVMAGGFADFKGRMVVNKNKLVRDGELSAQCKDYRKLPGESIPISQGVLGEGWQCSVYRTPRKASTVRSWVKRSTTARLAMRKRLKAFEEKRKEASRKARRKRLNICKKMKNYTTPSGQKRRILPLCRRRTSAGCWNQRNSDLNRCQESLKKKMPQMLRRDAFISEFSGTGYRRRRRRRRRYNYRRRRRRRRRYNYRRRRRYNYRRRRSVRGRNNFKRNVRGRSRRTRRSSALKRNMRGRSRRTRRPSALTRLASFSCVVMGCRGMNCETRHSQTSLKATQTITFDTKYVVTGGGYQIGEPLAVTGMSATPDPRTRIPTSWSCALSKPGRSSCVARACKIPPAAHCFPGNPGHAWMKCPHSTKEAGGESLLLTAPGYQLPRSSVKMSLAEVGIPAWEPKVRSTCPTAYGIALRHSRKRSIIHKGKFIGMERANKLMFTSSLSWLTEGPSRVLASYSCCRFRGFPCNLRGSRGVAGQDADSILAGLKVTGYVDFRDESVDRQKLTSKDVNCLWRKDAGKGVLDGDALLKQLTPAMRSVQTKANANPKGCAAMFKKKRIRVESLKVTMETLRRKIRTQASAAKRKVHHSIGELAGITTPSGKKFIKPAAQRQLQDAATAAVKSGPAFEEFRAAEQAYKEANQTLAAEQKGRYTDMGAADMNKKSPMHSDSGPGKCDSTFTRCCKCARKSGCVKCTGPGKYNCDANLFPNGHYAPPKYPASCTKGYGIIVTDPYLSTGYCQKIPAASGQCTEACHPKTLHDVHTRLACSKVCTISVTDENYGTSQLCHMGKVVSCECKSFSQVTKKCSAWKCTSVKQGNPPLSACANGLLSF